MKILISTGSYFKKMSDINDCILRAINHKVEGVEISLLKFEELYNFTPNKKVINRLHKSYSTVHAPTKGFYDNSSKNSLTKIKYLYDSLSLKNIVFHHNCISDPDYFFNELKGYPVSIENPDVTNQSKNYINVLEGFLKKYDCGLVLDVEHAKNDLEKLVDNFKSEITEVHWSYPVNLLNHNAYNVFLKDLKTKIKFVKKLKKPVVIEVDLRTSKELNDNYLTEHSYVISGEVELLRKRF